MTILASLDDFFRELKKEGISKGDVADRIGVTQSYLSKMLSGERPLTDSFTTALHRYYGTTLKKTGINFKKPNIYEKVNETKDLPENSIEVDERKQSLEKSIENLTQSQLKTNAIIENLTQNELRTTAIMERLVALMEKQYGGGAGPTLAPPGTSGTETLNPRKQRVNK